jgi:hypothetical protein
MKLKVLTNFSIIAVLALAASPATVSAADTTAKAVLATAQQAATKWNADAKLVNISNLAVNKDGTAGQWSYLFYSANAKKGYAVTVKKGKVVDTLVVRPHITDPVGNNYVDSQQAMQEAQKNGLKVKGTPAMSLLVMGQNTKKPGVFWTVGGGYTPGEVSIIVDAKTGKFFTRQEIK